MGCRSWSAATSDTPCPQVVQRQSDNVAGGDAACADSSKPHGKGILGPDQRLDDTVKTTRGY